MLKIAIVTNNYKPYSGGVVSSIDSFAHTLQLYGNKVNIITLDFISDQKSNENILRIKCPIKFTYKNNPVAISLRPGKQLLSFLKSTSPDIIHSQHPFFLGKYALDISKKLNIPIVFTYHTKYEEYLHYIPLPNFVLRPLVKALSISYCNNTDGIVVPSRSIYNYLNQNIKKPLKIIPSGILPIFENESFCQKKVNRPFQLLTVSRFVKEKNIYFLLDVFSKLDQNNFIFNLIGYGSELQNLKNYTYKKLGLSERNVKFLEKPNKEIISKFYRESDLFIFSSITETQGLVLAEAMSGATPVIALDASGSNDIVENGRNGFLVNSQKEMIQRINQVYENPNLHISMQQEAFKTSKKYNSINTTKKLIEFYREIIINYKK